MEATTAEERQGLMAAEEEEEEEGKRMKVLVPVDESDGSFYALKWAIDHLFSNQYSALEPPEQEKKSITLVNVQPLFQPFIYPAGPGPYNVYI